MNVVYYYRGDTLVFPFLFENDNGDPINYEVNDIIKFGAKKNTDSDKYFLFKEIIVEKECEEINFEFTPEETKELKRGSYLIELELTRNGIVETIYQDYIEIKEDVIR